MLLIRFEGLAYTRLGVGSGQTFPRNLPLSYINLVHRSAGLRPLTQRPEPIYSPNHLMFIAVSNVRLIFMAKPLWASCTDYYGLH